MPAIVTTHNISPIKLFFLSGVVAVEMYGCPKYAVYEQGLRGEAQLARAQQNRQIKIQEAQAVKFTINI